MDKTTCCAGHPTRIVLPSTEEAAASGWQPFNIEAGNSILTSALPPTAFKMVTEPWTGSTATAS
jgi:hypothetical protein